MTTTFNGVGLHQSDVGTYKQCRQLWHWSGLTRMRLTPAIKYAPFFTGSAVHYMIERWWAYGDDWQQSLAAFLEREPTLPPDDGRWPEEQALIDDQVAMLRGMMPHYMEWETRQNRLHVLQPNAHKFARDAFDVITVEQEFSVPIVHPITGEVHPRAHFAGKWDAILRHKATGKLYVGEYKTTRALPSRTKMLANEDQATMYLLAARAIFGPNVAGMLYTLIRKAVPPQPRLLATTAEDGVPLLSGNIQNHTVESYTLAIKEHHRALIERMVEQGRAKDEHDAIGQLVNAHYFSVLLALNSQENTYFQRHLVTRTEDALRQGALELWDVATEMTDPKLPIYRTPKEHCNYCSFRDPCIAALDGTNHTALLIANYRKRDDTADALAPVDE